MDEKEIERLAAELGARDGERADPDWTAHAVLARLRAEATRRPWWRRPGVLRAAAAGIIVIAAAFAAERAFGPNAGVAGEFPAPAELQELAALELAEVLDSLEVAAPVSELVAVELDDLNETQLRELLTWMESG